MKSFLIFFSLVLLFVVYTFSLEFEDPCSIYPTCNDCVASPFCGWCEEYIMYVDGQNGTHCASIDTSNATQWTCPWFFQTTTCKNPENRYLCDNTTHVCKETEPGNGQPFDDCLKACIAPTYICDNETLKCVETSPGMGSSKPVCERTCGKTPPPVPPVPPLAPKAPAKTYLCNNVTYQCYETTPGHGKSKDLCEEGCKAPPSPWECDPDLLVCKVAEKGEPKELCDQTCGVPHNVTPSDMLGIYRGFEISSGYWKGEFTMKVDKDSVVIKNPDDTIFVSGILRPFGDNEIWIISEDNNPEKRIRGLWETKYGPENAIITWAQGLAGGEVPPSYDWSMGYGKEFVFIKCLTPLYCNFSRSWSGVSKALEEKMDALFAKRRLQVDDECQKYPNCSICVQQKTCGWCSVDVWYDGGIQGKQCAGWNEDKSKLPFVCPGIYSVEDCTPPPPPPTLPPEPTYLCYAANKSCIETTPGHGTSKYVCEQTCGVPPVPSNSTPGELRGVWRGFEIDSGYYKGEWTLKVPEQDSNVILVQDPHGNVFTGNLFTVAGGAQLWIQVLDGDNKGLWIKGIWALNFGQETKLLTWAWGIPNDNPDTYQGLPGSFDQAMDYPGMKEFFFVSCLDDKEEEMICYFGS